jgi:hypothetical protein
MAENQRWQAIPTQLDLAAFEQFVLPHLSPGSRGPAPKLSLHKILLQDNVPRQQVAQQLRFEVSVSGLPVEGACD